MRVCSVDLEAWHDEIFVIGTKVYTLERGRWIAGRYRPFYSLKEARAYLESFRGLLVGHNWLREDLKKLSTHFGVARLVRKSADTLLVLKSRNRDDYNGMGLHGLALYNFGRGKEHRLPEETIKEISKKDPDRLLRCNHQDCRLAFLLWYKLINDREVTLYPVDNYGTKELHILKIDGADADYLIRPRFTYKAWREWVDEEKEMIPKRFPTNEYRPL